MKKIIISLIVILFTINLTAQELLDFKGDIKTSDGKAISFCNIIIKNHPTKGVISSYDGSFNISVKINDTLLISYIGYEPLEWIVKKTNFAKIVLKPNSFNLPEFVVKPSKDLKAKQVIIETSNRWTQNHYIINKKELNKVKIEANFCIIKDLIKIYSYKGITDLFLNDSISTDIQNTSNRFQTEQIPERILSLSGGTPHELISELYFKIPIEKEYQYEFGTINNYNGKAVYHIKFHRKKGGGACEGGGYYLISKDNFSLLYKEFIVKDCVGFDDHKKNETLIWNYAIFKSYFDMTLNSKSGLSKVESTIRYEYKKNNMKNEYYYNNNFTVNKIDILPNTNIERNVMRAKDVFYDYYSYKKE